MKIPWIVFVVMILTTTPTPSNEHIPPTVAPPVETQPGDLWTNPQDGSDLVLIPGGEFLMGSERNDVEKPVHTVHVDSFYLGKYEVTNAQWKKFVDAHPEWGKDRIKGEYHDGKYLNHWEGNTPPAGQENFPVVCVSWYAARAYCEWAGLRLPTEAEWEYAAQGGKGYEYGTSTGELSQELANYGLKVGGPTKVGTYPANLFGICDLTGNVWEWCSSLFKPYPYQAKDGREDDESQDRRGLRVAPDDRAGSRLGENDKSQDHRVLRGGCWASAESFARARQRYCGLNTPSFTCHETVGFRVAREPRLPGTYVMLQTTPGPYSRAAGRPQSGREFCGAAKKEQEGRG
jgi:formylglycine-generating enzyme required for sulfatase activity